MEYEHASYLDSDSFNTLIAQYRKYNKLSSDALKQENYYFESSNFSLYDTDFKITVRLRKEGPHSDAAWCFSLKEKFAKGRLESHQLVSPENVNQFLQTTVLLPDGLVKNSLIRLGCPIELTNYSLEFGTGITLRHAVLFDDYVLYLDEIHYLGKVEYVIEFESENRFCDTKKILTDFLGKKGIVFKKAPGKAKNYFDYIKAQSWLK